MKRGPAWLFEMYGEFWQYPRMPCRITAGRVEPQDLDHCSSAREDILGVPGMSLLCRAEHRNGSQRNYKATVSIRSERILSAERYQCRRLESRPALFSIPGTPRFFGFSPGTSFSRLAGRKSAWDDVSGIVTASWSRTLRMHHRWCQSTRSCSFHSLFSKMSKV
ncbi:hypothetical protein BKA80DRAFT_260858 [Phyllosticta citrichinensis]